MGPLEGVRVLDLTRVLAGPYCTQMLADMGADIIKVEHPQGGDETRRFGPPFIQDESAYFLSINRGKRSITIDLKNPDGCALVKRLVERCDVLVENFRPGVLQRLSLGPEQLLGERPRLIYVSISGFGHSGDPAWVQKPGYDPILQNLSGMTSVTGPTEGDPYKSGASIADVVAGIYGAYGVTLALLARERTGLGQHVDVSLLDGQVSLLAYHAGYFAATGAAPPRHGNAHPTIVPYQLFAASDGHIVVAAANDKFFTALAHAVQRPDWLQDPRFASNPGRVENREALLAQLIPIMGTRTVAEWSDLLARAGVPSGPVLNVAQVMQLPHLQQREMVVSVEHPKAGPFLMTGIPVKLSATPGTVGSAAPMLGADTEQVLREVLDCDDQEVAALWTSGALGAGAAES